MAKPVGCKLCHIIWMLPKRKVCPFLEHLGQPFKVVLSTFYFHFEQLLYELWSSIAELCEFRSKTCCVTKQSCPLAFLCFSIPNYQTRLPIHFSYTNPSAKFLNKFVTIIPPGNICDQCHNNSMCLNMPSNPQNASLLVPHELNGGSYTNPNLSSVHQAPTYNIFQTFSFKN